MAEAAGHPLPAEVVAGGIAIEQVPQEPARPGLPAHASPVHHVGRQPHAGVVVQPARAHQLCREGIDAGQAGGGGRQVRGEVGGVGLGRVAGLQRFAIIPDAVAPLAPEPLPVIAPAELGDQLLAGAALGGAPARRRRRSTTGPTPNSSSPEKVSLDRLKLRLPLPQARKHRVTHLRQREHPVPDIRRQAGDGPLEMVAAGAVAGGVDRGQARFGSAATAGQARLARLARPSLGARGDGHRRTRAWGWQA